MIAILKHIFDRNEKPDARVLMGNSPEKTRIYKQALERAAADQKQVIADYNRKFGTS
jgi:hypothetical protein